MMKRKSLLRGSNTNIKEETQQPDSTITSSDSNIQNNITNNNNNNKIILCGHSMGSGVSIVLSAAFPEWFSSLILLEGGFSFSFSFSFYVIFCLVSGDRKSALRTDAHP